MKSEVDVITERSIEEENKDELCSNIEEDFTAYEEQYQSMKNEMGFINSLTTEKDDGSDDETTKSIQRSSGCSMTSRVSSTISLHKENAQKSEQEKGLLKELESSSKGKVKGSLLLHYFTYANQPFALVFLIAAFFMTQVLVSVADVWVSYW